MTGEKSQSKLLNASLQSTTIIALGMLTFVLPPLLGDIGTAGILALGFMVSVGYLTKRRHDHRMHDMASLCFIAAFLLMAIAFAGSARTVSDVRFALNFAPLLLAIPTLWLLRESRGQDFSNLATLAALGAVLAGLLAVAQVLILGDSRAGRHLINPIHFSNVSLALGIICLFGTLVASPRFVAFYMAAAGFSVLACLLAAARGPLLGLVVVLPIFLVIFSVRRPRLALRVTAAAIISLVSLLAILSYVAPHQIERLASVLSIVKEVIQTGEAGDSSINVRLGFLASGIKAFGDAPIFGSGWDRIIEAVKPYLDTWMLEQADRFDYLHNEPLDFAVGAGLLGIVAYSLILIAPVAGVVSAPRDRYFSARLYVALALFAAFFVFGLTSRLFGHALQLTLYAFITMFVIAYGRERTSSNGEG